MTALLVWAMLIVGTTYGITCSAIFAVPRILLARIGAITTVFIYCSRCVGFWVGVALFPFAPIVHAWGSVWWVNAPLSGLAAMGLVEVLVGVFPGVLSSNSAFIQEQLGTISPITVESTDDPKEKTQDV